MDMNASFILRYLIIPLLLGGAGFAAVVTSGPGGDLSMSRMLTGFAVMAVVPAVVQPLQWRYVDKKRLDKRFDREDAAHRAAFLASFDAAVERTFGCPIGSASSDRDAD